MSSIMSIEACSNCGGSLRISDDKKKMVCDYCESEFLLNESEAYSTLHETSNDHLALQLFDLSALNSFDNDHNRKSFEAMCVRINAGNTSKTCLDELRNLTIQHTDWATDSTNMELLNKAKRHLGNSLSKSEQVLFFKDSTILSNGKSGILVTDCHIYCYNKKNTSVLEIKDIVSIHALPLTVSFGEWYFNENKDYLLDNMACSPYEQGMIMAFICLLAKEHREYGYRIKVCKGVR